MATKKEKTARGEGHLDAARDVKVVASRAAYDALTTYDNDTIYLVLREDR